MKKIVLAMLLIILTFFSYGQRNKNKEEEKKPIESSIFKGLKFRSIGPALTSGRVSDIAVDPVLPNTWFVTIAAGGVWKTNNAGTTWTPVFDDQGSYSIGCVTIDPNNHNVIWIGTGENNSQRSVGYGDGLYKSMDGGKSWKHTGLKNSEHIGNIVVHPENSEIVYVAAYGPLWSAGGDRGIYRTTDGGETWENILSVSEHTGFNEIHMDPRDPEIMYATSHQRRRHVYTYIGGGPESAIYKSTDGGENWFKVSKGLPEVDMGRIGLDVSPINPDILFAIIEAADGKGGFFKSVDRGQSWEKMSDYSTSGNYYQEIYCDPIDINRIYAMDTWLQVTDDGGKTFKMLGEKFKHVDNHAMWINPENNLHYLVGCDGGLYESFDGGKDWSYFANLPVTQFYKVSVDNEFPFYNVYGGTQDNFSMGGPSRTTNIAGIPNSDWYITNGGDGFESVIDPENPDIVYAQSQYGFLVRYDRKSGESIDIKPLERAGEAAYRWNWDAPLIISPHNATTLYFAANKVFKSTDRGNSWEVISDDLSRQIDRNKMPVMGKVWGMDAVAKNKSTSIYGNIVSLDESPLQQGLLYVGTDDGLVNITKDDGKSWSRVETFPGVPVNTYVNSLLASHHSDNIVYAAFNNHKNGDFKPYLLKSNDYGQSWKPISSNLPERGSVYSIAEDFIDPNLLFAGTEFGIFFSNNSGLTWTQLKGGIPTVAVRDIAIQKRENDLVLATFGRGFYVLDDYSALRHISEETLAQEATIFPVKDSWMFHPSKPLGLRGNTFQGSAYYAASNPPVAAVFTYYLKDEIKTLKAVRKEEEMETEKAGGTVEYPSIEKIRQEDDEIEPHLIFTISDIEGNVITKLKTKAKKGINRITWDFRYPPSTPIQLEKPAFDNPFSDPDKGPLALPGTYSVSLSKVVNGQVTQIVSSMEFKTRLLSNTTLPAKDKEALFRFQEEVAQFQRIVSGTANTLDELNTKLKYYYKAANSTSGISDDVLERIVKTDQQLKVLNRKLNGDGSLSSRDFETPPSITGRIYTIVYGLWSSTSAPTQTQISSLDIAKNQFEEVYSEIKNITQLDIAGIEKSLEEAGAAWTPGRLPVWNK
jgi:photosystem II stability/assembly factor-like uncharacterized protein